MKVGSHLRFGRPSVAGAGPTTHTEPISRRRLMLVDALIWFTTVLGVLGIFAIWADRQLFSPDNWANTSTQFLQDARVRTAVANYAVDELYANVNVAALISSGLPPRLQPLAGPASGALRNAAVQATEQALSRPRVQTLWARANRAADEAFIAIANGREGNLAVQQGRVSLNLASVVDEVAVRLGLPSSLGAKLPASFANLTIFKSDQLKFVQWGGNAVRKLALLLNIVVPLLYALAIALARGHRRRTLMTVGIAFVVGGLVVILLRSIFESQVTAALVTNETLRPAVHDVVLIGTNLLVQVAGACVLIGVVTVLAAWFAGPARVAEALRRALTPFLRDHPDQAYALVVAVMALIFVWQPIPATGTPVGIAVFLALALLGITILRRQVAAEFPDARAGEATAAIRSWLMSLRGRDGHPDGEAATGAGGVSEQLERLAELHGNGALTDEEYRSAKVAVLGQPEAVSGS